jgi:hypothetical protein
MNQLILAAGLLIGIGNTARAEECINVKADAELEYVGHAYPLSASNVDTTYGSTLCPRLIVDIWTNYSSPIFFFSNAARKVNDQATCESTQLRFTLWTWIPGIVVNGVKVPGHWSDALADEQVNAQWFPGSAQAPASCTMSTPLFLQMDAWQKIRLAAGLYREGQPLQLGKVTAGALYD